MTQCWKTSLIAANLEIELLTSHDRKKLILSNGDCLVSIRLSVGEIEAETRGTSNNNSCEKTPL